MNKVRNGMLVLLVMLAWLVPGIAQARTIDEAGIFSPNTISQLDQKIKSIKSAYNHDIQIVTVPSLGGQSVPQVAQRYITGPVENINGVYIFIAKKEKKIDIAVGRSVTGAIPKPRNETIRQAILNEFRHGNFDQGILTGVSMIEDAFRAAGPATTSGPPMSSAPLRATAERHQGGGISWTTIIIIAIAAYFLFSIIRSIGQRAMGGGGYGGGVAPGAPGYGGPGFGGGGGGFMSSLLGGLGGAMVGNWLYDKFSGREGGGYMEHGAGEAYTSGATSSDWTNPSSADTGWSSDGGGSWGGDSGSGGGDIGGNIDSGGDFGGGGGGDWS